MSDSDSKYEVGELVRVACEFTQDGAAIDPDDVFVNVRRPDGRISRSVYGTDLEVVKDSVGNYHLDVTASAVGWWHYYWFSTGDGQAAEEGKFYVEAVKAR